MNDPYFNQEKKRSVEFIEPDQTLKSKVGYGGLDKTILEQAQKLIEDNTVDFVPEGMRYITALQESIKIAKQQRHKHSIDSLIAIIANPAMSLKANGGMFGYPLITQISNLLIHFIEVTNDLDNDFFNVIDGFAIALNAVLIGGVTDDSETTKGQDLYIALEDACKRYFEKTK